jgi:FkbM family methyltransferase
VPAPVIIDAGSCIGMSVLYFKSVYPAARITAFEPDPEVCGVLRRNLERNGAGDVRIVNAGLGAAEGTATFTQDGADGGSMVAGGGGAKQVTIQVTRLSPYLDQPVDFLKMNIEGMEGDVFAEIEPKLANVKELAFEYHGFHDLPQNLGKILQILDRQGFRYAVTDATNAKIAVPITLPKDYRYFNLVYARRG